MIITIRQKTSIWATIDSNIVILLTTQYAHCVQFRLNQDVLSAVFSTTRHHETHHVAGKNRKTQNKPSRCVDQAYMSCFLFSLPTFPSFYDLKMNFSFYISSSLLRMGTINFLRFTTKSCYHDMTHIKSVNYPNMECRSPLTDNLKISNAIFRDCRIK